MCAARAVYKTLGTPSRAQRHEKKEKGKRKERKNKGNGGSETSANVGDGRVARSAPGYSRGWPSVWSGVAAKQPRSRAVTVAPAVVVVEGAVARAQSGIVRVRGLSRGRSGGWPDRTASLLPVG